MALLKLCIYNFNNINSNNQTTTINNNYSIDNQNQFPLSLQQQLINQIGPKTTCKVIQQSSHHQNIA